ncbi:MAG: toll/interleukin-1 receptor domain-containing protein [Lewinellaceae bacterium]|nr:toll/interleukin-1 receptor domain-containing protein [Lewinellaceae bacterium]
MTAVSIFLSYSKNEYDKKAGVNLKKSLFHLSNRGKVSIQDRDSEITGGVEIEDTLRYTLKEAQIVIILLSHDYLSDVEKEFDLIKDITSKDRQKKVLFIKSRQCDSDIVSELSWGRFLLHDENKVLFVDKEVDQEAISEAGIALRKILADILEPPPQIDLAQLVSSLLVFSAENNINSTISLLKKIVKAPPELKQLKQLEIDYVDGFRKFGNVTSKLSNKEEQLGEKIKSWRENQNRIQEELKKFIHGLRTQILKENWQQIYSAEAYGLEEAKEEAQAFYNLFTPADEIKIPFNLKDEDKQRYKRLFYQCQDAFAVDDFEEAYKFANRIKSAIEPESAQLYEYLLLTYFKMKQPEQIILNALEGDGKYLKHISLYAGRFKEIQEKLPQLVNEQKVSNQITDRSLTGEDNTKSIADSLFEALRNQYTKIQFNHIIEELKEEHASKQELIKKSIESALLIHRYTHNSLSFLDIAVNELCGGGKFHWIEAELHDGGTWHLRDVSSFNAVNRLDEIKAIIDGHRDRTGQFTQSNVLADNLLFNLELKYNEIRQKNIETEVSSIENRRRIIQCFNSFKVAFMTFENIDNRQRFLKIPIDELRGEKMMTWFTFNEDGRLVEEKESRKLGFKAREELEQMLKATGQYNKWSAEKNKLTKLTYNRFQSETEEMFRRVRAKKDRLIIDDRKTMIECMKRWKICYKVFGDLQFVDHSVQELIGNRLFQWFDFKDRTLISNSDSVKLGFNPLDELEFFLTENQNFTKAEARFNIAKNCFKIILQAYEAIIRGSENKRPEILCLIEKALACHHLFKEVQYLKFVRDELVGEKKLKWFDTKDGILIHYAYKEPISSDPFILLKELLARQGGNETENKKDFEKAIAYNRHRDVLEEFDREISQIRSQQGPIEKLIAVRLFEKCEHCFKLCPDVNFLDLPIMELEGRGRIRWFWNIFGWKINAPSNLDINFNYRKSLARYKNLREMYRKETVSL